jgi:DUF1365 family protein
MSAVEPLPQTSDHERASCLYEGWVRHRRTEPIEHSFRYRVFLLYLDLDELPAVFAGRWLWAVDRPAVAAFRREDHVGPKDEPLPETIRSLVQERTGRRPEGPIRLLTHLRYCGYCFNPVSFYYCFDRSGRELETIVAEVTNTPWGERHCYVLDAAAGERRGEGRSLRFRFPKSFHVSPFIGMAVDYDWRFVAPAERLVVHMESASGGRRFFGATMRLDRRAIDGRSLARVLLRHPLMTGRVTTAIHVQALRLWWKRAPFFPHPAQSELPNGASR